MEQDIEKTTRHVPRGYCHVRVSCLPSEPSQRNGRRGWEKGEVAARNCQKDVRENQMRRENFAPTSKWGSGARDSRGCLKVGEMEGDGNYRGVGREGQVQMRMDCYRLVRRLQRSEECRGHQRPYSPTVPNRTGGGIFNRATLRSNKEPLEKAVLPDQSLGISPFFSRTIAPKTHCILPTIHSESILLF